jgi:hypothetical protein
MARDDSMTRQRLLLVAVIAVLAAPSVLAQSRGDVIAPPPIKSDGSVIAPPAAHADPGIEKGKPPEQAQLPEGKDKPGSDDAPIPKTDKDR